MVLRFSGFELDRQRAELRGPDGEAIKLRPKTLGILILLATNAGRVVSKQELMDAIWPNIHVGDDSLFQCIREVRTALGDDRRQLVRLVSGQGYLFTAEVSVGSAAMVAEMPLPAPVPPAEARVRAEPAPLISAPPASVPSSRWSGLRRIPALAIASLGAIIAVTVGWGVWPGHRPPAVAVMPIAVAGSEDDLAAMAANVTPRLADGLAKIENIRVAATPRSGTPHADFVVSGELQKTGQSWEVHARMTRTSNGEVVWTAPVSVVPEDTDVSMQQSRLAAGIGHPLARRIGVLTSPARPAAAGGLPPGSANVVIEQATAAIVQTNRERFAAAQAMLEKALAADPDNVDLAVSLAALQMRGVQMVWYSAADSAAAQVNARSILERALRIKPGSIPVLEAYCRFLNATNEFADSLVACARTLNFDPWNGMALYLIGLDQLELGRFEDALATFKQANRFDTPQVSRWTWRLGVGMAYLFMGRSAEAVPWLKSSIAITPASGRTHMLLAAAYLDLGQPAEAKAAMGRALALRPGSNLDNVTVPRKNASPDYIAASDRIGRALVAAGLPER